MGATTVEIAVMAALVVGFGVGFPLGSVAKRSTDRELRRVSLLLLDNEALRASEGESDPTTVNNRNCGVTQYRTTAGGAR